MRKVFIFSVTVLCFISHSLFADLVYFGDGLSHTINDGTYSDSVIFLDENFPRSPSTHLEVSTGGVIGYIEAHNYSSVTFNDGEVENIVAFNNSTVNINGGIINDGLAATDDGVVTISDGRIKRLYSLGNSTVLFYDGSIANELFVRENSIVSIYGGKFSHLPDFGEADFYVEGQSTIYLYGSNFSIGGLALDYGDNLRDFGGNGRVIGTLLDGSLLNNHFSLFEEANVIIIPEPATLSLLALGAFFAGRKRR